MLRAGILTREWPPDVYGGAGVHVEELVRELRPLADVRVHAFGPTRDGARGHQVPPDFAKAESVLQILAVDLDMVRTLDHLDVVHSHTWYTNHAGHVAGDLYGIPHVITAHSLEPRRPWKAEQLGGGYRVSSWIESSAYREAAAIIAVSDGMRRDVLDCYPFIDPDRVHVVRNGIDPHRWQKGIRHLLAAAEHIDPSVTLVFCASAPDEPAIGAETAAAVAQLERTRPVVWIQEHAPRPVVMQLYSHALAFLCPSVYEPLGIVNLEAMACGTAVVASDVGGIPEVVAHGDTGLLVHYDADDTDRFEREFAAAVNSLIDEPVRAQAMGVAGRERAVAHFGWDVVARKTVDVYTAAGAVAGATAS